MKTLYSCLLAAVLFLGLGCSGYREQKEDEYFNEGREAAREGAPPGVCPYEHDWHKISRRAKWMKGYRKGLLEKKAKTPEAEKTTEERER